MFFHDDSNVLQTRRAQFRAGASFQSGDRIRVDVENRQEQLDRPFSIGPNVTVSPGRYEWNTLRVNFTAYDGRKVAGSLQADIGDFYSGTKRSLTLRGAVRPNENLSFNPSYGYNNVDLAEGSFDTHLVALQTNVSFTTDLLSSTFLQYNSRGDLAAVQIRFNYIFRQIDNIFLVYSETRFTDGGFDGRSNRSLILKATYSLHR